MFFIVACKNLINGILRGSQVNIGQSRQFVAGKSVRELILQLELLDHILVVCWRVNKWGCTWQSINEIAQRHAISELVQSTRLELLDSRELLYKAKEFKIRTFIESNQWHDSLIEPYQSWGNLGVLLAYFFACQSLVKRILFWHLNLYLLLYSIALMAT